MNRRRLLWLSMSAALGWCILEPWILEPYWLRIRRFNVSGSKASHRLVHITDIHYKGNRPYLEKVVNVINTLTPDFVCFSGDLVEDEAYLHEALDILSSIKYSVYGVPGNHDYRSGASFSKIAQYCEYTGGAWLVNQDTLTKDGRMQIIGATGNQFHLPPLKQKLKHLLLVHYPLFADQVEVSFGHNLFDLVLAGHSHGGQVRFPFWGPLILPNRVGFYDLGFFQTKAGLLYVNPGIGTFFLPVRLLCRPEITLIEV